MKKYNLIIAAMDEEMNSLLKLVPSITEVNYCNEQLYEFVINNEYYLLGRGKIGKVHTAHYLTKLFETLSIKRVFNIGTSGGVNNKLNLSDVVIATKVAYHDVDVTGFNYKIGQMCGCPQYFDCDIEYIRERIIDKKFNIVEGLIVSGDQFITKSNFNKTNIDLFKDALCCDMEAGAVGHICHLYNIPFLVIRSISDIVTKDNNAEMFDNNLENSSTNSALVLLEIIK